MDCLGISLGLFLVCFFINALSVVYLFIRTKNGRCSGHAPCYSTSYYWSLFDCIGLSFFKADACPGSSFGLYLETLPTRDLELE